MMQPGLDVETVGKLAESLPTPPLLTSKEANWNNVFLAYYQHPGAELNEPAIPFHVLEVMDVRSQVPLERRFGKKLLSHPICDGEIFLCPAQTEQWIEWKKILNFSLLVFDPLFIQQLANEAEISKQIEFIPQWQVFDPVIQKAVNALKADLETGCPVGFLYGQVLGRDLAKYLLKNYSTSKPKISQCSTELTQLQRKRVLERIYEHILDEEKNEEEITEAELAQIVGVSSTSFGELFYQSIGMSLFKCVIALRLEYAKQLLKSSDYKITEVALKCGYNDSNYFTRQFRHKFGITPSDFRKQKQNVLVDWKMC